MDESTAVDLINALYGSQRRGMLRYLVHVGASPTQAEDVVQDAFIELYSHLREGKPVENPRPWLFTVARRAYFKQSAARQSMVWIADDEFVDPGSIEQRGLIEHSFDDVERLLGVLTSRQRQVIILRLSGLKYREIANELGISLKTAHTLLTRGLRKLSDLNNVNSARNPEVGRETLKPQTLQ